MQKLEDTNKELSKRLNDAKSYNEMLSEKYSTGKNLMLTVVCRLVTKPVLKAFNDWKLKTQRLKNSELEKILKEKLVCLEKLIRMKKQLEIQNVNLLSENEDLRQASLDGIEIANVCFLIIQ